MAERPAPLSLQTLLQARFLIEEVLGQGEFGITYRAKDLARNDLCIVRELAPEDAVREPGGVLQLSALGEIASQRLRHRFRQEAKRLMRASGQVLPPIRSSFAENGTAYLVREFLPNAKTLAQIVGRDGPLEPRQVERLLVRLATGLEYLHINGILHLDLHPHNVLIGESGEAYLIDFGESRKWHRDLVRSERTSDGLAPEIETRGARMTPQADVYSLASTLYFALSGAVPPKAWPQFGEMLSPLNNLNPNVPTSMATAIDKGLRVDLHERPRTMREFLDIAQDRGRPPLPEDLVAAFDEKALELKSLRFNRRQCPACRGVLENPKPLRLQVCAVCHEGRIKTRKIVARLCPNCRMGTLKQVSNEDPLAICPLCAEGLLHQRRKGLFSKEYVIVCDGCEAVFARTEAGLMLCSPPAGSELESGAIKQASEWRDECKRSHQIWLCNGCGAQYDTEPDGRWRQAVPSKIGKFDTLEPLEWARVAAGLPPDAGNAECEACGADYFVEGTTVALLETRFDPHHFAERGTGRIVTFEELRWMGVGKESPNPGLVCGECSTELDFEEEQFRFVRSPSPGMQRYQGQALSLENWHRAANELPMVGEEKGFDEAFGVVLREAFQNGSLPFSAKDADLLWKSPATRFDHSSEGWKKAGSAHLEMLRSEVRFGGLVKKTSIALEQIERATASGNRIDLKLKDGAEPVAFELEPIELTFHLESGPRAIRLDALDLLARLRKQLEDPPEVPLAEAEENLVG